MPSSIDGQSQDDRGVGPRGVVLEIMVTVFLVPVVVFIAPSSLRPPPPAPSISSLVDAAVYGGMNRH